MTGPGGPGTRTPLLILVSVVLMTSLACSEDPRGGNSFVEVSKESGIDYRQYRGYNCFDPFICGPEFMTGGAAARDFDVDGWVDLVATRNDNPPILYRNRGDGTFEDVTARSQIDMNGKLVKSNGAGWADLDADGCADLVLTTVRDTRNYLFMGDCEGNFREEWVERGLGPPAEETSNYSFGVAFGDFDRDGWTDFYVGTWRFDPLYPNAPANAKMYRNLGPERPGYFEDVTEKAGVKQRKSPTALGGFFGWTPKFVDLDGDGWQDLPIASDFRTSHLFWNNGDGTFRDGTKNSGDIGTDENGMGSAVVDLDGDSLPEWFISSIYQTEPSCDRIPSNDHAFCSQWGTSGNRLYKNVGDRKFLDVTEESGVRGGGWGWGSSAVDYDNDSHIDIAQTAGQFWPYQGHGADLFHFDPTRLWRNTGDMTFVDVGAETGIAYTKQGKGLVSFDYDRDGFMDFYIVQNFGDPKLFRNTLSGNGNGWLRVLPVGSRAPGPRAADRPRSNIDGWGAKVTVVAGKSQYQEHVGGNNFLGQDEPGLHFGLGKAQVGQVRVEWPASGCEQTIDNVERNQTLIVYESDCLGEERKPA